MTGPVVLDLTLLALLCLYAWSGWRQGFVSAVFGVVGLLAGGLLALRVVPGLAEEHAGVARGTAAATLLLAFSVLLLAVTGQLLMLALARRVGETVTEPALRALDSVLGLLAVLATTVLVLWVVTSALAGSGPQELRTLLGRSAVVAALDELVPSPADRVLDQVTAALGRGGFPQVFEGLGPEPISPVRAPDPTLLEDPGVRAALDSVVHLRADAERCGRAQVGSGWVLGPERVVTNAHVVAGSGAVEVRVRDEGPTLEGRVVAFDPSRDVAVLAVAGLRAPALERGPVLAAGDPAVLAGFPLDEGLWVGGARVRDVLDARGADIYDRPGAEREVYSLRASVRRGASGGPVLDRQGRVVGMVFATSQEDPDTGYAVTLTEMAPVLRDGAAAQRVVPTPRCAVT